MSSEALLHEALALEAGGEFGRAFDLFRSVTLLEPTCGRAWRHLGNLFRRTGEFGAASECFERAIAAGDDVALNKFFLSAVGVGDVVPSPPRHFVSELFNQYAVRFDQHLLAELDYRAPALLHELMRKSGIHRFERGLDLGCGTGLVARAFRGFVARLVGVDVSEQMVARATASGLYERLTVATIEDYLEALKEDFDLVLCCDTFIYLGDLDAIVAAVGRALVPGGSFGFTVEAYDAEVDFELLPSLRYAHTERYIRRLAVTHGFRLVGHQKGRLRNEDDVPVQGLAFHLAKAE